MNVLNRRLSKKFTKVHKAAEEAALSRGKQFLYKFTIEHPQSIYWASWGPIMLFEFIIGFYLIFRGKRQEIP